MIVVCPNCLETMHCPIKDMGITVVSHSREAIYRGDKYTCGQCGAAVITDFGQAMTRRLDNFDAILLSADNNPDAIHLR